MAENSKDELKNKQEQARVDQKINDILTAREKARKQSIEDAATLTDLTRQITEDIKDQMGMTRAKSEADKDALSLARELSRNAQVLTTTLGGQAEVKKQLIKDERTLEKVQREAQSIISKISDEDADKAAKMSSLLLNQQADYAKIEEKKKELQYLDGEAKTSLAEEIKDLEEKTKLTDVELENQRKSLKNSKNISVEDVRRLTQLKQQERLSKTLIATREDELEIQKGIEERTGVTGALVEGVGGIMQRLGMRSGIFQTAMTEAADAMKAMAEETERGEKNFTKAQIALKGMTKLAKGFGKALTDPLSITLAILDGFFKVDAAATKVQRLTGQNSMELAGMNDRLATSVDFLEVTAELTEQMGMNAQNAFSPKVIAQAAELKNVLGLAANEAAGLATIAQTTVGDVDGVTDSVVGTVSAFNKANRAGVSQGVVLKDVATASADIKASLSGNPEALAHAASAARRMGLELSKVDQIASSLMDFESSIEAELEAQLLTGKNINMSKARELALNNDLAGLGKEIFKNSADLNDFGKMNRIQQEAQAKALGISREELGKIAYARAIEAGMTEEAAEAAAGVTAEDMKRLEAQEAIQLSIAKLQQAFAPLLGVISDIAQGLASFITPIAKVVGMATSTPFGKLAIGAAVLLKVFGGFGGIIGGVVKGTQSMIKGFGNYISKVAGSKGILEKSKSLLGFGGDATKDAQGRFRDAKGRFAKNPLSKSMDKGAEATGKMQQKTKGAKGKGPGGFLKSLGDGLASIGKQFGQIIKGALALGIAGVAIGGSFALALRLVKDVDPVQMVAFSASIALFGGALALLGKMSSQVIKGSIAMGILSLAVMGFATAFSMLENVDTDKMIVFSIAVPLLGLAAAGLGYLSPFIYAGALAIAALGLSLLPLAGAFALLGAVNVEGVLSSLSSFASMTPGLLGAGAGLLGLSAGLISLSAASLLGSPLNTLTELAALAPSLATVGVSLTAIAAGLSGIALALSTLETEKINDLKGLVMTTAMAAPMVAAAGAISSMIQGISGGGEGDSNSELLAEIKALRAVVEKGGNINMDGNKVGQYIMLSANKSV